MRRGNILVEQVTRDGLVVYDFDQSLSPTEIYSHVKRVFPNIEENGASNFYHGSINQLKYAIRIKNITYLGHPHPLFKKRIQISDDLHEFAAHCRAEGYAPFLLGIYTYHDNVIYCEFNIDDYIMKMAHNSSAHVSANDLREATRFGYFEKTDMNNNRITAFHERSVLNFLYEKFEIEDVNNDLMNMLKSADAFMFSLDRFWLGTRAYKEMYEARYQHWKQAEWFGFYLEYLLDNFLQKNPQHTRNISRDELRRGIGQIDLDVYYPALDMYGDLKAHNTVGARGIIANDYNTIDMVLQRSGHESIYYIIASGVAVKDLERGSITSRLYSELKGCKHLSYADRMKYSFELKEYYVLDLNNDNRVHAQIFEQGRNSNGKPRNPKLLFPENSLNNFVIHRESMC